jgi:hypothetical protein
MISACLRRLLVGLPSALLNIDSRNADFWLPFCRFQRDIRKCVRADSMVLASCHYVHETGDTSVNLPVFHVFLCVAGQRLVGFLLIQSHGHLLVSSASDWTSAAAQERLALYENKFSGPGPGVPLLNDTGSPPWALRTDSPLYTM